MSREKGGVYIEWCDGWYGEDLFIEDLSIAGDDQDVGALGLKGLKEGGVAGCRGL